jgi:hypothetical protein
MQDSLLQQSNTRTARAAPASGASAVRGACAPRVASARVVTGIQIKTQDFVGFFGLLLILKT